MLSPNTAANVGIHKSPSCVKCRHSFIVILQARRGLLITFKLLDSAHILAKHPEDLNFSFAKFHSRAARFWRIPKLGL